MGIECTGSSPVPQLLHVKGQAPDETVSIQRMWHEGRISDETTFSDLTIYSSLFKNMLFTLSKLNRSNFSMDDRWSLNTRSVWKWSESRYISIFLSCGLNKISFLQCLGRHEVQILAVWKWLNTGSRILTDEICDSHTCRVSLWILSCLDHIVEFSGCNISGLLGFFAQCVLRFASQDRKKHSHHNNTH